MWILKWLEILRANPNHQNGWLQLQQRRINKIFLNWEMARDYFSLLFQLIRDKLSSPECFINIFLTGFIILLIKLITSVASLCLYYWLVSFKPCWHFSCFWTNFFFLSFPEMGHVLLASLKIGCLFRDILIILTGVLMKCIVRTDWRKAGVEKKEIIICLAQNMYLKFSMEATNYKRSWNSGVSCLREHSCFVSGLSLWRVMLSGRNAWGHSPQQVLLVVRPPHRYSPTNVVAGPALVVPIIVANRTSTTTGCIRELWKDKVYYSKVLEGA